MQALADFIFPSAVTTQDLYSVGYHAFFQRESSLSIWYSCPWIEEITDEIMDVNRYASSIVCYGSHPFIAGTLDYDAAKFQMRLPIGGWFKTSEHSPSFLWFFLRAVIDQQVDL